MNAIQKYATNNKIPMRISIRLSDIKKRYVLTAHSTDKMSGEQKADANTENRDSQLDLRFTATVNNFAVALPYMLNLVRE